VCEQGECDFVKDIAAPLPMAVIGDMLGVLPDERELFLKWSDDMMEGLSSTVSEADMQVTLDAFMAYNEYTMNKIEQRRAEPTEDLISVLVHAEVDGQRLSDDDILQETLLILVGGDETTRHTISGGTEQLIRHPEQWDLLQTNPDRVPLAIEEMLRWTSPLKNMARTITADTDFHGTQLRNGEKMLLMFESANFDEAVFGDPDNFNVERDPNSHLAFGFGTHFCLGNQLARIELINMISAVLKRLPDLQLADSAAMLPLRAANFVSGLEAMPVTFTPTKPVG
jgi:cytochrome P450 family 142 subfamily A polypeptide 1